jgi:hypothetical protein
MQKGSTYNCDCHKGIHASLTEKQYRREGPECPYCTAADCKRRCKLIEWARKRTSPGTRRLSR